MLVTIVCFSNEDIEQAVQYCKEQFQLSERNDKGVPLREVLEKLEEQLGYSPPELSQFQTELPECFQYVWTYFLQLHSTRNVGMGLCPITYSEIKAFAELENIEFEPEEVQMIKLFDNTALSEISRQEEVRRKRSESQNKKK